MVAASVDVSPSVVAIDGVKVELVVCIVDFDVEITISVEVSSCVFVAVNRDDDVLSVTTVLLDVVSIKVVCTDVIGINVV